MCVRTCRGVCVCVSEHQTDGTQRKSKELSKNEKNMQRRARAEQARQMRRYARKRIRLPPVYAVSAASRCHNTLLLTTKGTVTHFCSCRESCTAWRRLSSLSVSLFISTGRPAVFVLFAVLMPRVYCLFCLSPRTCECVHKYVHADL